MKVRVLETDMPVILQWVMDRGYYDEANCALARNMIRQYQIEEVTYYDEKTFFYLGEIKDMTPEDQLLFKLTFAA